MTYPTPHTPQTIVATSESELAAVFEGIPGVEAIESGREDGTGDWAFEMYAEEYAGHAFSIIHITDEDARHRVLDAAREHGHEVMGTGHNHILVREGRQPLPEKRHGLDAWDSLREGDRFTHAKSIEYEATSVTRDDEFPGRVREVRAVPAYKLDQEERGPYTPDIFSDAYVNQRRLIRRNERVVDEGTNVKITEWNGEFVIPDE